MRKLMLIMCLLIQVAAQSQQNLAEKAAPVVAEGKRLYRSEMASWYGTDLFMEQYQDKEKIGGYFSYGYGDSARCIFVSKGADQIVIGEISFDSTYDIRKAKVNMVPRKLSQEEAVLFNIRQKALADINADKSFYKTFKNTSLNLVPLISEGVKKVYVLTGPAVNGVVIFGNDYLLTFDDNGEIKEKKSLHQNIIPVYTDQNQRDSGQVIGTTHNHQPETGDFMTATDICTLMLYGKFTKWQQHMVVSEKYINVWHIPENRLVVIPRKADDSKQ